MRARYAVRLGEDDSEEGRRQERVDRIRKAFNSPFWPFVLATTSVGQEGLDFHLYCHAVAHWNLPSNPVDLEQREGRVHRYKGHAVRRNVARRHGGSEAVRTASDPWEAMFQEAREQRAVGLSDLVPYWLYAVEGGAKIERHVPMLPLSRDVARLPVFESRWRCIGWCSDSLDRRTLSSSCSRMSPKKIYSGMWMS